MLQANTVLNKQNETLSDGSLAIRKNYFPYGGSAQFLLGKGVLQKAKTIEWSISSG